MAADLPIACDDPIAATGTAGASTEDQGGSGLLGCKVWKQKYIPGPSDLKEFDLDLYSQLSKLKQGKVSQADFQSFLEATNLPNSTSEDEYIRYTLHTVLIANSGWQMSLVRAGFRAGMGPDGLQACSNMLTVSDMAELLCGSKADASADFDVKEYFRVVLDSEARECPELIKILFEVSQRKSTHRLVL